MISHMARNSLGSGVITFCRMVLSGRSSFPQKTFDNFQSINMCRYLIAKGICISFITSSLVLSTVGGKILHHRPSFVPPAGQKVGAWFVSPDSCLRALVGSLA